MQFTFSKEIIPDFRHTVYGDLGTCGMFTVMDDTGSKVGKFFYNRDVSFFAFGEADIRIDYVFRFFRPSLYPIIDQQTGQQLGNYKLTGHTGRFVDHGKLFLGSRIYNRKMQPPSVKRKMFKKNTWGYYSIEVSNYPEVVTYHFNIEHLSCNDTSVAYRPFKGNISMEGENLFLLFAGILLVQDVLEGEDWNSA